MFVRKFLRNKNVKQESFHAHFTEGLHQGESDFEVRLIDQGVSNDNIRRREFYWQHEQDTFQPNEKWPFFNSTLANISLFMSLSDKPATPIPI